MEEREGRSRESSLPRGLHQHLLQPPEPSMTLPALVIGRVDEEVRFEARPPRYLPRFPPPGHGQYVWANASSPESHVPQEISESSPGPPSYFGGVPRPSPRPTSGPAPGLYDYRPQYNISDNRSQPYTPGFSGNHPPSALRWGTWQEGEAGPSSLSQRHQIGDSTHEPHRHEAIQNRGIAHPVPRASHELPYEDARWPHRPGSTTSSLGLHLGRGSSGPITPPRRTHSLGATPGGEEPPAWSTELFEHNALQDECEKSKDGAREVPLPAWLNQETSPGEDGRKRRRVFKKTPIACRFCRARKLRCNGTRPSCHNCTQRRLDCLYDLVARRRGPGKAPKGPKGKQAGPITELTGYEFELEEKEKDGESMEQ